MAGAPANHDVFLSYSRADTAAANALRDRLVADGNLKVFIDWRALAAGRPWQPALEAALLGCRAMLVLVGPKGIGGWQHREIQLGLDRQTGAERTATPFPVIPVLLPGLEPDDYPLGTFLALNTWVAFKDTVDEPLPLQHLLAAIHGQSLDAPRNFASLRPYRGLLAFREQDAGLFFGRERFVDELIAKVRQRSRANVVAVLGRSGSGKSSVVFAGLFPALRQEKGVGQQAVWNIASLRPGKNPLLALIETFDPPEPSLGDTETLAVLKRRADLLRKGEVTLAELVTRRIDKDQGTTRQLLYVDQWEELYTQAQPRDPKTDEDKARAADARRFIDLVLDAAAEAPCTVVLTVRSDFYPDLQTHDRLRAAVQDCQVSLGPMTKAELTAAIEGPAKAVGGSVESELTKRLLRDIGLEPANPRADHYDIGKLPLLQYALEQAWAKARHGQLGVAHYAGLEQALEDRANDIFDRLSEQQRAAATRLFVSLVTPGEGREDTRARIVLEPDSDLSVAAQAFAADNARLVVTGDDGGARAVEVSHEALIRHWDRLRSWIDANRAKLRTRADLISDRVRWLENGKDPSLLIEPGLRLEAARSLFDQPGDVVVGDLTDYLSASFAREIRQRRLRTVGVAAAMLAAGAMAILASVAFLNAREARLQTRLAVERADQTTAALIWSRLDFEQTDDPRSEASVRALWDLATGNAAVRDAFLQQLAQDRYQVATLADGPASILRAFGLRPEPAAVRRLLDPVLDAIRKTTDPNQLQALAQAVQTLGPKLAPEQAQAALGPVLDAIRKTTDPNQLQALAQAVQTLGPKLAPEQAQAALGPALDAIRQTTSPTALWALAQAIQTLAPTPDQAQAALRPVFAGITQTTDYDQLEALAHAVETLGPSLAPQTAQAVLGPLLGTIGHTTGPYQLQALAQAVQTLGSTPEQAQAVLGPVLDTIRRGTGPYGVLALAQAVQTLGPKLTPEQAQAALGPLIDAIRQTTSPYQLRALSQAVHTLGPTPEQAEAAFGSLLGAIRQTTNLEQLQALAQAIQTLGPTLAPEYARAALGPILEAIGQTTDPYQLQALTQAVQTLRPTPEQARAALEQVLDAFRARSTNADQLRALAQAVQTLGPTPEQAEAAVDTILYAIIRQTNFPSGLQALALANQALGPKLAADWADSSIELSRTILADADDPDVAAAFARAIAVTLPLDPANPQPYVAAIIELLKWPTTAESGATEALLEVLYDRVPGAPGKEAGLGATVQWVADTLPEIDLDSPPTPPASGSTGAAW